MGTQFDKQCTGNAGLYFVASKLSFWGLHVVPTARNAAGVDLLIYSRENKQRTVQVKSLRKMMAIPLGRNALWANILVAVVFERRGVVDPTCFVFSKADILEILKEQDTYRQKRGLPSRRDRWIDPPYFRDSRKYVEKWNKFGMGLKTGRIDQMKS